MNSRCVTSIFWLVLALLMIGTSQSGPAGSLSNNPGFIDGPFTTTVRKLMRVIANGIRDLYHKVSVLKMSVTHESIKQDRLRELVMKLGQALNSTSVAFEKYKNRTEVSIVNMSNEVVSLKVSNLILKKALLGQDARVTAAIAKVTEITEGTKFPLAQLQTELVEGTFAINQSIHNRPASNGMDAIRIVGGGTNGKVEVKYLGEWTLICDDEWTQEDATVVCGMLGLSDSSLIRAYKQRTDHQALVKLDKVACVGNEKYVINCPHIGTSTFHLCANNMVAAVECRPYPTSTFRTTAGWANTSEETTWSSVTMHENPTMRLIGGGNGTVGRLEVKYNDTWGTVCDDDFDEDDARVVCASLHLPSKQVVAYDGDDYPFSKNVPKHTPIWLDQVNCKGNETNIFLCGHNPVGQHDCTHPENAGVKCG